MGLRSMVYVLPACTNSSMTTVLVCGLAKWLRSVLGSRSFPLVSPNNAKAIASKIVVLPAPVLPEIR